MNRFLASLFFFPLLSSLGPRHSKTLSLFSLSLFSLSFLSLSLFSLSLSKPSTHNSKKPPGRPRAPQDQQAPPGPARRRAPGAALLAQKPRARRGALGLAARDGPARVPADERVPGLARVGRRVPRRLEVGRQGRDAGAPARRARGLRVAVDGGVGDDAAAGDVRARAARAAAAGAADRGRAAGARRAAPAQALRGRDVGAAAEGLRLRRRRADSEGQGGDRAGGRQDGGGRGRSEGGESSLLCALDGRLERRPLLPLPLGERRRLGPRLRRGRQAGRQEGGPEAAREGRGGGDGRFQVAEPAREARGPARGPAVLDR